MPGLIKTHTSTPCLSACKLSFNDRTGGSHAYTWTIFPGTQEGGRWAHSGEKASQCGKSLAGEGEELRTPLTQPGGGALSVRRWVQGSKMSQPLCETGAVGICPPSTTQGTGGSTHRLERGLLGATACRCPGGMDHPLPPGCKALEAPPSQDPRGHE